MWKYWNDIEATRSTVVSAKRNDAFEEEEDRYTQAYLQSNDSRFDEAFEKYKQFEKIFTWIKAHKLFEWV